MRHSFTMQTARRLVAALVAAVGRWQRIDEIRAKLPEKFARRIPGSRAHVAKAILAQLLRQGAITRDQDDLDAVPILAYLTVGAVALVGTAAAVAAVAAVAGRITGEVQASKRALRAAEMAEQLWQRERVEAAEVGTDRAAELRSQRAAEVFGDKGGGMFGGEQAAAGSSAWDNLIDAGAGIKLPAWTLPAALAAGALLLLTGQRGIPYARRRLARG